MKKPQLLPLLILVTGFLVFGNAQAVDMVISGEDFLLIIDVDGDGPEQEDDCVYRVEFNDPTFAIRATQGTIELAACTGNFFLDLTAEGSDESSDWVELDKSSSGVINSGGVPGIASSRGLLSDEYEIEIIDESGFPDGRPLDINWIRFEDPPGGDNVKAEMFICDDGGNPTLAIEIAGDMLSMHIPFVPYPTAQSPEFLQLKNLPFAPAGGGGSDLNLDVYLPLTEDGHLTAAEEGRPNDEFIDIDFDQLTDCSDLINIEPTQFKINSAISDAWFLPATAGQGFFIIVWEERKLIFMAWFTYDTELPPEDVEAILGAAGQRWLVALGPYSGDTATLEVFVSSGMVFDSTMPPVTEEQLEGATITIRWTDCEQGFLVYNIPTLGLMGEIPIERIVDDNVEDCVSAQSE